MAKTKKSKKKSTAKKSPPPSKTKKGGKTKGKKSSKKKAKKVEVEEEDEEWDEAEEWDDVEDEDEEEFEEDEEEDEDDDEDDEDEEEEDEEDEEDIPLEVLVIGKGSKGMLVVRAENTDGEEQEYDKDELKEAGLKHSRKKDINGYFQVNATKAAQKKLAKALTAVGYEVSFADAPEEEAPAKKAPAKKGKKAPAKKAASEESEAPVKLANRKALNELKKVMSLIFAGLDAEHDDVDNLLAYVMQNPDKALGHIELE